MISGLMKHSTRITGKLSEMSAVLTTSFFFFYANVKPLLWLLFPLLELFGGGQLHTCICQMEGREAEWEQMTAKRGNRGTVSGDNFLSQFPNLRVISPSVGVKGLRWSIAHVLRCLSVWYRAGVRGRRLRISVTSEIRLLGGEVNKKSWFWMCDGAAEGLSLHQKNNSYHFLRGGGPRGQAAPFCFQHLPLRLRTDLFNFTVLVESTGCSYQPDSLKVNVTVGRITTHFVP